MRIRKKDVVTNEDKIRSLLRQDRYMTAGMLATSVEITQRQAQRILAKLKDKGKILRHGAEKWILGSERLSKIRGRFFDMKPVLWDCLIWGYADLV